MMVKPTVAELLKTGAKNRFELVIMASKGARQISLGSKKLTKKEEASPVSLAADEIFEGKVTIDTEETEKGNNE